MIGKIIKNELRESKHLTTFNLLVQRCEETIPDETSTALYLKEMMDVIHSDHVWRVVVVPRTEVVPRLPEDLVIQTANFFFCCEIDHPVKTASYPVVDLRLELLELRL